MDAGIGQRFGPIAAAVGTGLLALALVVTMVVRTSGAAFSTTTDNTDNSFLSGDVTITDDDTGALAMFTTTSFSPGDSVTECIAVSYQGSIADPGPVQLYSGGYTDVAGPDAASTGLSDHIMLTIEEGAGGTFADCTGFLPSATIAADVALSSFAATATDYASGLGTWDPATSPETRTYRFTATLDADTTPNAEQGAGTTDISFVWEVSS